MPVQLHCRVYKRLADTDTPISVYLKLRDRFAQTLLMESADHSNPQQDYSYICCDPMAGIRLENGQLSLHYADDARESIPIDRGRDSLRKYINKYMEHCQIAVPEELPGLNGLFGYCTFESVSYTEDICFKEVPDHIPSIPELRMDIYRYIIVFDHFRNECCLLELYREGDEKESCAGALLQYIDHHYGPDYPFATTEAECSGLSDEEYLQLVHKGQEHCFRGDVFQLVLSRDFTTGFKGDEFKVYRALRSINPSQYLFYYDYGDYRLFGSSPEAQLRIREGKALINPIAGTFRRTGDEEADARLEEELKADQKENAEHTMLIDLARNDLSKHYREVEVTCYKEIRRYSHVMHMVSEVEGAMPLAGTTSFDIMADTFPAGTLSGAPKYRAMQLIDQYEAGSRGFYGGSIGFLGFDGSVNQAIMIRSFMSKGNQLHYRAGAGIVAASVPENELNEIYHKIAALRLAIQKANQLNYVYTHH